MTTRYYNIWGRFGTSSAPRGGPKRGSEVINRGSGPRWAPHSPKRGPSAGFDRGPGPSQLRSQKVVKEKLAYRMFGWDGSRPVAPATAHQGQPKAGGSRHSQTGTEPARHPPQEVRAANPVFHPCRNEWAKRITASISHSIATGTPGHPTPDTPACRGGRIHEWADPHHGKAASQPGSITAGQHHGRAVSRPGSITAGQDHGKAASSPRPSAPKALSSWNRHPTPPRKNSANRNGMDPRYDLGLA